MLKQNEGMQYGIIAIIALFTIIASQTLSISDFLSGLLLGFSIMVELVSLVKIARALKKED